MTTPTHITLDSSRFEPGSRLYRVCGALAQAIRREDGGVYPTGTIEISRLRALADAPDFIRSADAGWPTPAPVTREEIHAFIGAQLAPVPPLLEAHRAYLERVDSIDLYRHLEARYRQLGGLLAQASDVGAADELLAIDRSDVYYHRSAIVRLIEGDARPFHVRSKDIEDMTEDDGESLQEFPTLTEAVWACLDKLREVVEEPSRVYVRAGALPDLLLALRLALWAEFREQGERWAGPR